MTRSQRISQILFDCAAKHNAKVLDLRQGSRTSATCRARQEAAFRLKIEMKLTLEQIGAVLHISRAAVIDALGRERKRLGIAPRVKPFTPADDARMYSLLGAGFTQPEVAKAMGRTLGSIKQRMRFHRLRQVDVAA